MAAYDDLVAQVQAAVAKVNAQTSVQATLDAERAAHAATLADMEAKLQALVEQLKPVTA